MAKTVGSLPVGSKVTDTSWVWEHKTGNGYTGSGMVKPVTWLVAAKNHYVANSVTLVASELVAMHSFGSFNGYDVNHWSASDVLRVFVENVFYDAIGQDFRQYILDTDIPCAGPYGGIYFYSTKIYVPSSPEMGEPDGYSYSWEDGSAFDYFTSPELRKCALAGNFKDYWLRSPLSGRRQALIVNSDGTHPNSMYPMDVAGVRPVCNVRDNLMVTDAPNADGVYEVSYWVPPDLSLNIGGVYKKYDDGWVNINGVWKQIDEIHANINGVWKKSE